MRRPFMCKYGLPHVGAGLAPLRIWLFLAGLNGALGVMAAAYGWHALGGSEFFDRGAQYQLFHAIALAGVALLANQPNIRQLPVKLAGICLQAGIIFFSGSLYKLVLTGTVFFPGSAPIGGNLLIAGWLCLCWAAVHKKN